MRAASKSKVGSKRKAAKFTSTDGDDDFITLKRADHALDEDEALAQATVDSITADAANNMSKRKLAMGQSKKAMAAAGKRGIGEKLVFDEDGEAHQLYELQNEDDFKRLGDAKSQAEKWEREERERLERADIEDKERARDKRREKRRKQKERERALARGEDFDSDEEVEEGDGPVVLAPIDNRSDGYETPDFDVGSESSEEEASDDEPSLHRSKKAKRSDERSATKPSAPTKSKIEQEEELALRLLAGGA